MKRFKLLLLLSFGFFINANGQTDHFQRVSAGITPMHTFFKQYADSTIIVEFPSNDGDPAQYQLLSKTKGVISAYIYQAVDNTVRDFHKAIYRQKAPEFYSQITARKLFFSRKLADINIFFKIIPLPSDTLGNLWLSVTKFNLWQLNDDRGYPVCPAGSTFATVTDGGYIVIHLITKYNTKTLYYYAPEFYEEQCPGNTNRKHVISLATLFAKHIPFE